MGPHRLPRTVVPTRYDLRLAPDLATARFTGEETVAVTVHEPAGEIVLNAAELRIDRAALALEDGTTLEGSAALDGPAERCRVSFGRPVPAGRHRLRLAFEGALNDKLRGFYRSSYRGEGGQAHWLAATQFEATDARRAFPCWDEPSFKAVFACTLVVDPALTVLSNTSVAEEARDGDRKAVRFADTIPLPTYLIAFVVGNLESSAPVAVGKTPVRVWCVPGKRRLAEFGRDVAAFSLGFFEDYFGHPYPGDKLDLVAIPDFASGAMENFGLITFRETALLVDPAAATHAEQERVADVVAHENAHLWFGDVVTMSWWNGLWLKEAFATFMEMLAVDAWKPHWQRWTTFGVSRAAALLVDGLHSTRPVEFPVRAPGDAEAMFDVLTYEKGCCVLRMLEQHVGADLFRAGAHHYLERHAYGNADTGDLWAALGEASGLPIPRIMDGWIFQPGYPLLSVEREEDRLVVRQQRFTYLPSPPDGTEAAPVPWRVPVRVRSFGRDSRLSAELLDAEELRIALPPGTEAVLVNEGGHGFYRAHYAPDLLAALLDRLPVLTAIERFDLVGDCWALVLGGKMRLADYLDLTARFRGERDKNVWSLLAGSLHTLNRIIEDADRPGLAALVRDRAGPAAADLGWSARPGDDELTRQLRGDLLRLVGTLGEGAEAQRKAAEAYADPGADASVLAAAVGVLAHAGDDARYAEFEARFRSARTPQEEQRYLLALAGFRPPHLVDRTLARTLGGDVRTQDAPFVVRTLLMSPHGRGRAWAFVRANWDRMSQEYPVPGFRRMGEGLTGLATPALEREVQDFVRQRGVDLGGKTLAQYLEQLRIVVSLRQREGPALKAACAPPHT